MTDDDKALVERLRNTDENIAYAFPHSHQKDCVEAADRIEVLSGLFTNATYEAAEMMKEIERLREALAIIVRETTAVSASEDNERICIDTVNLHARAVLAGDTQ